MIIIAVNAGSSSLKFQLLEMPSENVLASGVVERIGMSDSIFSIKYGVERHKEILEIKTHKFAVDLLLKRLIELFSDKYDVVIDPVAGSASTLIAARQLRRHSYGFEIDKDFYKKAQNRINGIVEEECKLYEDGLEMTAQQTRLII